MTDLSAEEMIRRIVESLERTGRRFDRKAAAKRSRQAKQAKRRSKSSGRKR